jgi:isoleucyl-tRNA synthetase
MDVDSVHLSYFPENSYIERQLLEKMDIAQKVVYMGRAMRAKHNLKIRQPLLKMMVAVDEDHREALQKISDVILEELNIKEMIILADDSGVVNKSAKPNFKAIGPKHGKNVNPVANAIRTLTAAQIQILEQNNDLIIHAGGADVVIEPADVEILRSEIEGWIVQSESGVTVALDLELNDELIQEGLAREFVNRVQNLRKDSGFEVTDRIRIKAAGDEKLMSALNAYSSYICTETLSVSLDPEARVESMNAFEIEDYKVYITIQKISV